MRNNHLITYAQNREDIILSGFFDEKEKGFYVDVGANDPVHESVTKLFYDKGWQGINLEPIPTMHEKLVKARSRDINLAVGVGAAPGTGKLHYYPYGDGLSTLSEKMAKDYKREGSAYTAQEVVKDIKIDTLKSILGKYAKDRPIQFMKVDVEGYEYEALAGNDWDKFRPEVICIEANHIKKDWRPILKTAHYSCVFFDGLNEYYADDATDRAKRFDYVRTVIFHEPIVNFRLLGDFEQYENQIKQHKSRIVELEKNNEVLSVELKAAQKLIAEVTPLKKHIKRQVGARLSRFRQKEEQANNHKKQP